MSYEDSFIELMHFINKSLANQRQVLDDKKNGHIATKSYIKGEIYQLNRIKEKARQLFDSGIEKVNRDAEYFKNKENKE